MIDVQPKLEPDSQPNGPKHSRAILLNLNRFTSPDEGPAAPLAWDGLPKWIVPTSGLLYVRLLVSPLAAFITMLGK